MYRTGFWYTVNNNLKSLPGLTKGKKIFSNQHGAELVGVKRETIGPHCRPSLMLCASCHLQQSPEANTEECTEYPLAPRASHRNCAVSFFSTHMCIINPIYISLINLYLRHWRLRKKPETSGLDWQMNVIFLGKNPCVYMHRHTCWPCIAHHLYENPGMYWMFHPSCAHSNTCRYSLMSLKWAKLVF